MCSLSRPSITRQHHRTSLRSAALFLYLSIAVSLDYDRRH